MMRMLVTLICWFSFNAFAHKPSDAYVFVVAKDAQVSVRWDIALRDLDAALDLDADGDRQLTWGEVNAKPAQIQALLDSGLQLVRGSQTCSLNFGHWLTEQRSDGNYLVTLAQAQCGHSGDAVFLTYRLFAQMDAGHRGILSATVDGAELASVLNPAKALPVQLAGAAARTGLASFVADGMHHILIGWDHILFLICLLLPCVLRREGGRWRPAAQFGAVAAKIALTVTAFTLAHSVTLALAAFEVVQPPVRLIESLIAITVVLAALNNVVPVVRERTAWMALAFGFIHGFGFANVLAELALPREQFALALLGFNVGVELGQLLIVAIALTVLYPLRTARPYVPAVLKGGSLAACLLASVWLVERVFDLSIIST